CSTASAAPSHRWRDGRSCPASPARRDGPSRTSPGSSRRSSDRTRLMAPRVSLATIAREWGRIGCIGFRGPPTHISLLRRLEVERRAWMSPDEIEDGVAAVNLLPGPASTQLTVYAAWLLRGVPGALLGGACFIVPGLVVILGLS